jgi:hypothetical protein
MLENWADHALRDLVFGETVLTLCGGLGQLAVLPQRWRL